MTNFTSRELATILVDLERNDPHNQRGIHWSLTRDEHIDLIEKTCNDFYQIKTLTALKFALKEDHPLYLELILEYSAFESTELWVIFNEESFISHLRSERYYKDETDIRSERYYKDETDIRLLKIPRTMVSILEWKGSVQQIAN